MCYPIAGQSGENVAAGAIHNSVPVPVHSEGDLSSSGPPWWSGFGVPRSCRVGLLHPSFSYGGSHARHRQIWARSISYKLLKPELPVRMVGTWNSLPEEVVQAPTLNAFKAKLVRAWMNRDKRYNYRAKS